MRRSVKEELTHFLSDMYSVELQALAQLVTAPDIAGDTGMASDLRTHHAETQRQADMVRARLEAAGGSPSAIKDAVMKLGGKAFLLFARAMPETPGRLAAHAYSYEAMEWAGYEMLVRIAQRAGDSETAAAARTIRDEERLMMRRLEQRFEGAERASHHGVPLDKLHDHVRTHLTEAHALEGQSVKLLERSDEIGGDPRLAQIYRDHAAETRQHARLIEDRLAALGGDTSAVKDAALRLGGLNWSLFFQAQSDTPAKLAAFVYAAEHLEIGGYELLRLTARRARDADTERLCEHILAEERAMAARLADEFETAVRATLEALAAS